MDPNPNWRFLVGAEGGDARCFFPSCIPDAGFALMQADAGVLPECTRYSVIQRPNALFLERVDAPLPASSLTTARLPFRLGGLATLSTRPPGDTLPAVIRRRADDRLLRALQGDVPQPCAAAATRWGARLP